MRGFRYRRPLCVSRDQRIERHIRMVSNLRKALTPAAHSKVETDTKVELEKAMHSPTQPELFS